MTTLKILKRKWFRRIVGAFLLLTLFFGGLLWYANYAVASCGDAVYSLAAETPEREYGLLLGTAKLIGGKLPNLYFNNRIAAAAELYHAGKIKKIIASGDNRHKEYNETEDMRLALLELGVKGEDILSDYAGFRTLDSVVRAKTVFGVSECTVISQQFHCERAIFIARHHGIDAIGFAALDVGGSRNRLKRLLRELPACLLAWCDVNVWDRKPHFEK